MTEATVYVDRRTMVIATRTEEALEHRARPDALAAVRDLQETGHRVVLFGSPSGDAIAPDRPASVHPPAAGRDVPVAAPPIPAELVEAVGWLVTADAGLCSRVRSQRGLRTILVGPAVPGRGLAHRPSDLEARDLPDAVMTILTSEAMPERGVPIAAGVQVLPPT